MPSGRYFLGKSAHREVPMHFQISLTAQGAGPVPPGALEALRDRLGAACLGISDVGDGWSVQLSVEHTDSTIAIHEASVQIQAQAALSGLPNWSAWSYSVVLPPVENGDGTSTHHGHSGVGIRSAPVDGPDEGVPQGIDVPA